MKNNIRDWENKSKSSKKLAEKKESIRDWAKELKHNENFAKKYEGVTTVEDILNQARKDGYSFGRQELIDFDLSSVAGGVSAPALGGSISLPSGNTGGTTNSGPGSGNTLNNEVIIKKINYVVESSGGGNVTSSPEIHM
ncbi:MAG: Nif11-like leader peptide family natural product precursor [Clostridia bacterium]|nr:Nif11-like leader peptide family natural product precursor [Clostridia bacterium]